MSLVRKLAPAIFLLGLVASSALAKDEGLPFPERSFVDLFVETSGVPNTWRAKVSKNGETFSTRLCRGFASTTTRGTATELEIARVRRELAKLDIAALEKSSRPELPALFWFDDDRGSHVIRGTRESLGSPTFLGLRPLFEAVMAISHRIEDARAKPYDRIELAVESCRRAERGIALALDGTATIFVPDDRGERTTLQGRATKEELDAVRRALECPPFETWSREPDPRTRKDPPRSVTLTVDGPSRSGTAIEIDRESGTFDRVRTLVETLERILARIERDATTRTRGLSNAIR